MQVVIGINKNDATCSGEHENDYINRKSRIYSGRPEAAITAITELVALFGVHGGNSFSDHARNRIYFGIIFSNQCPIIGNG